jgi:hypothetical protein
MLKEPLYILVIALGIPTGLFLSNLCKEELESWKHKISSMILFSFLLSIVIYFTNFQYKTPIIISLLFIVVTSLTILKKSRKKYLYSKKN